MLSPTISSTWLRGHVCQRVAHCLCRRSGSQHECMLVFVKLEKKNHPIKVKGEADAEKQVQMFRDTESCPIGMTRDICLRHMCCQYSIRDPKMNQSYSFRAMKHHGNVPPGSFNNSDSLSVCSTGYLSGNAVGPYIFLPFHDQPLPGFA